MDVSDISNLSIASVEEFQNAPEELELLFSIDDHLLTSERVIDTWIFSHNQLRFTVDIKPSVEFEKNREIIRTKLIVDLGSSIPAVWDLLYQTKVRAGVDKENLPVIDIFNIDFSPGIYPLTMDLINLSPRFIMLEMRTLNMIYWPLPTFEEGDLFVSFKSHPCLRTWRALLALVSPQFAEKLADFSITVLDLDDFPRKDFETFLFQLYPTKWSLFMNFDSLARVAVKFDVSFLVYYLSKHLIELKELTMPMKWKLAMEKGLNLAMQLLVFKDVEAGVWERRIASGFCPETFFSQSVYHNLICPMVLAGRGILPQSVYLSDPWKQQDYFSSGPFKVSLIFLRTRFFVNQGVLAVNGMTTETAEMTLKSSVELQYFCGRKQLLPGKVLIALLDSLHPGGPSIEDDFLHPAIVICHDNGWKRAKENMEQRLLHEPITTSHELLEQLLFAEKFGLENMLRALLLRAEKTAHNLCVELMKKNFPGLSADLAQRLTKRLIDSWSNENCHKDYKLIGQRKPTRQRDRIVENDEKMAFRRLTLPQ